MRTDIAVVARRRRATIGRMAAMLVAIAWLLCGSAAHAWENGGYIVLERVAGHGRAGLRGPAAARYREVYPHIVGCTFPVSADAGLVDALAQGCGPDPRAYLQRRFADSGLVLVYLPRTLYDTLYAAYSRGHGAPSFDALRDPDRDMLAAWRRHASLQPYYLALIQSDAVVLRHERFNAWAAQWLLQRAAAAGIDAYATTVVLRPAAPQLQTIAASAIAQLHARRPDVVDIVVAQIALEQQDDDVTYLFKAVDDEAAFMHSTLLSAQAAAAGPLAIESVGFSGSLYASMFGDRAGCVYCELDANHRARTVLRIPLRLRRPFGVVAEMTHVPALPPLLTQHVEHSALAQPRTRLFASERALAAGGMQSGALQCAVGADPDGWNALGWLVLDRKPMRDEVIAGASERFMRRIAEQATVVAGRDPVCSAPAR